MRHRRYRIRIVLLATATLVSTYTVADAADRSTGVPGSGAGWSTHGPGGAEVASLAIDPKNPSNMFASTGAGVFGSTDGGTTWQSASRGLGPDDFVSQVAIAPSQPRVLYAVRGWPHEALFRSSDRARSWRRATNGLKGQPQAVAIDPGDAQTVYAATAFATHTLFKSLDGGRHWAPSDSGIDEYASISAIAIDPTTPNTLYAAGGGIYKSVNGGATWTNVFADGRFNTIVVGHDRPNMLYAGEDTSVVDASDDAGATWHVSLDSSCDRCWSKVFIDPSSSRTAYASSAGLYRTTDGGSTWKLMRSLTEPVNAVAVDPTRPSDVFAGTTSSQVPRFIGAGVGVYESIDGGRTWNPRGHGLRAGFELTVATAPSNPGTVYAGGSSGVARSADGGRRWARSGGGLPEDIYVESVAVDPTDARTAYAGSTNAGVWGTADGGATWEARNSGLPYLEVSAVAVDPVPGHTVFAGTLRHDLYRSTDRGASWEPTGLTQYGVDALAVDPSHPGTIYAETYGLFRSTDDGVTWRETGLSHRYFVHSMAIAGDGTIYATATRDHFHGVIVSTDGGRQWNRRSGNLPNAQWLGIAVDPTSPTTAYVGSLLGVFVTTDGGSNWTPLDDELHTHYVLALAVDGNGDVVHAATGGGGVFDRGTG